MGSLKAPAVGSIADALFTKVQQRVLGVLFASPHRAFYLKELIQLADVGTGAVHREVAKLTSAGIITLARVGNQTRYQANPACPVYDELLSLIRKTVGVTDVLRNALSKYARDIDAAFVFGSVAAQSDTARSDIDVLVLADNLAYGELFGAIEPASTVLGRPVNPTIYTKQEFLDRQRAGNAFVSKVMESPKMWIIGDGHDIGA
ncbi:nucleotidyltransferase domain-containing protein [Gemmatimonas sp.]|jgi:predicted nucleotidyltransferase|uniref:nucleotidyltransferase domain-containing protein n=1 Tax=Gemmatimonas sp. TaxID=1962908 RepID=UPI0037C1992E